MNSLRTLARALPARTRHYSRNIRGENPADVAALGEKNGALFVRETAIASVAGLVCAGVWWVTITAPTQRAIDDYYGEYNRRAAN